MNKTTKQIETLQEQILQIKKAINLANSQTLIRIDNLSISDALIKVAQPNKNANRFKERANFKQKNKANFILLARKTSLKRSKDANALNF